MKTLYKVVFVNNVLALLCSALLGHWGYVILWLFIILQNLHINELSQTLENRQLGK